MDINIILASVITGLIVSVISGITMMVLKRRWDHSDAKAQEIEELKKQISLIQKCVWRLNKTVLIFGKIIDGHTNKVHAELNSSLEDIASELLNSPNTDTDKG